MSRDLIEREARRAYALTNQARAVLAASLARSWAPAQCGSARGGVWRGRENADPGTRPRPEAAVRPEFLL